jgi:hypothetical protein
MFAGKQMLCAAIPMEPPSQCLLQEPLLEKSSEAYANVHQHEKAEEVPSLIVVDSSVLANIQPCSFLLGLLIAFFIESTIFSVHVLTLAMFGNDDDPDIVTLFSNMLSGCFTSVIIILGFFHVLDRYPSSGDPSEENNKTITTCHMLCRFGLETLVGVNSAFVLIDLCYILLLGLDVHIIKYSAGTLVCVTMLTLIFHFFSGNYKLGQVTLFGWLVETNKVDPILSSTNKHGTIDLV